MGNCCSKKSDIIEIVTTKLDALSIEVRPSEEVITLKSETPNVVDFTVSQKDDPRKDDPRKLGDDPREEHINFLEVPVVYVPKPFKEEVTYHIALKSPRDTSYMYTEDDKWNFGPDINIWIQDKFKGINYHSWIVYNNQLDKDHSSFAHSKGIVVWNDKTIMWLINSIPNFPETFTIDGPSRINKSELIYGQSLIFIDNISSVYLPNIKNQLNIMHVHITNSNSDFIVTGNKNINENKLSFTDKIHHVAKSKHFNADLYENCLVNRFGGSCFTETWIRGHKIEEGKGDKVSNIKKIKWPNGNNYTYTHDHSKYAISDSDWICISDINRMTSQYKRGGGGIVIQDQKLQKLFMSLII